MVCQCTESSDGQEHPSTIESMHSLILEYRGHPTMALIPAYRCQLGMCSISYIPIADGPVVDLQNDLILLHSFMVAMPVESWQA